MATRPVLTVAANLRLVNNIQLGQLYYGSWEAFLALYPNPALPIFGVAPQTFATTINIPFYTNPTTAQYATGPGMFIDPSPATVLGQIVSTTVNGGTLTGVNYTDVDGNNWTTVDWQWVMLADIYQYAAGGGVYSQQIINYIGDDTSNRAIASTLDLTKGNVAVWILGGVGGGHVEISCMRHNGSMSGTSIMGDSTLQTTAGIMSFTATGFTVTKGTFAGANFANKLNTKYTAIVMQDTTSDRRYLRIGSYVGVAGANSVTIGDVTNVGPNTDIWVWGRGVTYVNSSLGAQVSLALEAYPVTGEATVDATTLVCQAGKVNVNNNGTNYYYVALHTDTAFLARNLFKNFTGSGVTPLVISGLGFTPSIAVARRNNGLAATGGVWRGPDHTGTDSAYCSAFSANDIPVNGMSAFGSGTVTVGSEIVAGGDACFGFAYAGGSLQPDLPTPTWTHPEQVVQPLPDGTTPPTIIVTVVQQIPPTTFGGPGYPFGTGTWVRKSSLVTYTKSWWCNSSTGQASYQIESPGTGWVACSGPVSVNGWYYSVDAFGGGVVVVSGGRPADPRTWANIATWATGNTGMLGGSPAASCGLSNALIYPATGYTVGTDYPSIRMFNGRSDREMCKLPPTSAGVVPKAVLSMLTADGTVFLTTFDSGTTSANWSGRVFQLDIKTGILTTLGTAFAAGEMPYALAWHMDRLWCGTNNGIGTVGKVYYFRPGVDTAWTLDHSLATETLGGVNSMRSYRGKLYVGSDNAASLRGKILERDTAGVYTVSETGAGGTAIVNNGYLAMVVFGGNLYASYWNNDTTPIALIRKFDGTTWTTVFTGATTTLKPFILLFEESSVLYAVGGGKLLAGALLSSTNGTTWTNLTAYIPDTTETLLPIYGVEIL